MEYVDAILHLPLALFHFGETVFRFTLSLPWPTWNDIFRGVIGSFISFLILWKPRDFAERRWFKRRLGRKKATRPPDHHNTAAAASMGGLFHGH